MNSLRKIYKKVKLEYDKEHVTTFLRNSNFIKKEFLGIRKILKISSYLLTQIEIF